MGFLLINMLCYKAVGETTSEFATRLRHEYRLVDTVKVAICGKLDPQAEGNTIVLFGEDTKKMPEFLQSDKTYEFFVAIGVSTDSDDIMGGITGTTSDIQSKISTIKEFMMTYIKNQKTQKYHPISAKKIKKDSGKKRPLWYWHKKGVLTDDDLPRSGIRFVNIIK